MFYESQKEVFLMCVNAITNMPLNFPIIYNIHFQAFTEVQYDGYNGNKRNRVAFSK